MQPILSAIHEYGILPFIIIISAIVFAHEFGHYWVARRCGIRIVTFSIGFGSPLFGWTDRHGTRWQVGWLPLGGYVKMFGDADASSATSDEAVKSMSDEEKKVSFFHQHVNKRIAVVVAGPAANYLLAIAVFAILFMFHGQPFSPPVVGSVQEGGVAAQAGLQAGDKIVAIDGSKISRFEDIVRAVALSTGSPMPFVVERNGADLNFTLTPEMTVQKDFLGTHSMGRIGIVSGMPDFKKWPPLKALKMATIEVWTQSGSMLKAIGQILVGTRGSDEIGGPVRIAQMLGHAAEEGPWALVWFMGIISINLGLVNLFPVPMLDGGHLLFYVCEKIMGRPLNEKIQEVGMRIGLALITSLMIFATSNDLHLVTKIKALFS